jgi:hypothetical protein
MKQVKRGRAAKSEPAEWVRGQCLCGNVELEIGVPARWAWHDHSAASRRAHGAAYATYVGSWKSRCRVRKGEDSISSYEDKSAGRVRRFCTRCGTPLMYERSHSPTMVNIPRALFHGRTGREPRYHIGIQELQDWTYLGERLVPLKGFPGVVWTGGANKKKYLDLSDPFDAPEPRPNQRSRKTTSRISADDGDSIS